MDSMSSTPSRSATESDKSLVVKALMKVDIGGLCLAPVKTVNGAQFCRCGNGEWLRALCMSSRRSGNSLAGSSSSNVTAPKTRNSSLTRCSVAPFFQGEHDRVKWCLKNNNLASRRSVSFLGCYEKLRSDFRHDCWETGRMPERMQ